MTGIDLRAMFFDEAEELLQSLDETLRLLHGGDHGSERINAVFRAVHSIKGGAAAFQMHDLVAFSHSYESLLDDLRSGQRRPDATLTGLLVEAADHLRDLVLGERDGPPLEAALVEDALHRLKAISSGSPAQISVEMTFEPIQLSFDPLPLEAPDAAARQGGWRIVFVPHPECLQAGHDPALLLRDLAALGAMEVEPDFSRLVAAEPFDPALCQLGWTILLWSRADAATVRSVFEFMELFCDLMIEALPAPDSAAAPEAAPPPRAPDPAPPDPAPAAERPGPAATAPRVAAATRPTIRVDVERVDRLADLAGELVIQQAMISEAIGAHSAMPVDLGRGLDHLRQLSRQIQESAMALRAQPLKPVFERMHRILREAASESGKQARLQLQGEMTEVDRAILESLSEPLTHMVRNAVDHGLEPPDLRRRLGKDPQGCVRIAAEHRSGRIVITVSDDGAGIDRARVRAKAIEKGLLDPAHDLSPAEIDTLLFLPGFSTAESVSSLSGRGVGMDAVKSAISALGGRISITSVAGAGTTLVVSLPLTLAVMDGMVISVAGQHFVLPVSCIVETLPARSLKSHRLSTGRAVVELRGEVLPVIDVADAVGQPRRCPLTEDAILVIAEQDDLRRAAFLVDMIRDQRQVVIKSLEENYGPVGGVSAATVLGDGTVALILDPEGLHAGPPAFHPAEREAAS